MLCGIVCGPKYGLLIGFITPLLRSFLFSMPIPIKAIGMAFELATYGFIIGILYYRLVHNKFRIYISLITAMIAGRIAWGVASIIIYGITKSAFTWQMFLGGALVNAIPGILLQIILIPLLILTLEKSGVLRDMYNWIWNKKWTLVVNSILHPKSPLLFVILIVWLFFLFRNNNCSYDVCQHSGTAQCWKQHPCQTY